jgi:hypothetical protein
MSLPILTPPSGQYPSGKVSTALPATPQQQPPTPNAKTAPLNDDTFVKQGGTPTAASKPRSINTEPEEDTKPTIEATTTEPEKPPTHESTTSKLPLILSSVAAVGSLITTGLLGFQLFEMNRLKTTLPKEIEDKASTMIKNQLDTVVPKIQNTINQGIATAQASTTLMVQTAVENSTKQTLKTVLADDAVKPIIENLQNSTFTAQDIVETTISELRKNKTDVEKTAGTVLKLALLLPEEKVKKGVEQLTGVIDTASYEALLSHLLEQQIISQEFFEKAKSNPNMATVITEIKKFANSAPSNLTHAQTIAEGLLGSNDLGGILQTVHENLSQEQLNSAQKLGTELLNKFIQPE